MATERSLPSGESVVVAVGVVSLAVHVSHVFAGSESLASILYGVLVPAASSVLLVGAGLWLHASGFSAATRRRVAGWCLGGLVTVASLGLLTIRYQAVEGATMSHQGYFLAATATAGALFGTVVGVYDGVHQEALDRLAERRAATDRLNERLTVLNRVLRHDVRNSVNVIRGHARPPDGATDATSGAGRGHGGSGTEADAPDVADRLALIREESARLMELSEQARAVQRAIGEDATPEPVELVEVVEDRLSWLDRAHDVDVSVDLPARQQVLASPEVDLVVQQLLANAVEHSDRERPSVEVTMSSVGTGDERVVELAVADDGPGIPDHETRVLERGEESSLEHSDGIGLWLVHWVVAESRGSVSFEENDPRGSVVRVRLPVPDDAAVAADPVESDVGTAEVDR